MKLFSCLTIQVAGVFAGESETVGLLQVNVANKGRGEVECFAKNPEDCGPGATTTTTTISMTTTPSWGENNVTDPPPPTPRPTRPPRTTTTPEPTTTTFSKRPDPTTSPEAPSKCSWQEVVVPTGKMAKKPKTLEMIKDCTDMDMFEFKLCEEEDCKDPYVTPTYEPDEYGEDGVWRTFSNTWEEEGWSGACVAYAQTAMKDCEYWCEEMQGMRCVRGMDDAHHQTDKLTKWLEKKGYTAEGPYGGCTIVPGGHDRQTNSSNGCNQIWDTQICACVEKD